MAKEYHPENPELAEILDSFKNSRELGTMAVKSAHEAGKVIIGSFCQYAPMEIINAPGFCNFSLCGLNYDPPVPLAETKLPANLCPLIKSSYGNVLGDYCPFAHYADLVVGETTCDGKKKMYEMLAEMKPMYVIHLPNNPDWERSLEAWRDELEKFRKELETRFNVTITDDDLRRTIKISNEERRQQARIYELGKFDPPAITGMQMRSVMSSVYYLIDKEEKVQKMTHMVDLLEEAWREGKGPYKPDEHPPRILISGAAIEGVKEKTLEIIEDLGGAIVCYEGCCGISNMRRPIDETKDPMTALAEKYLDVPCAVMSPNQRRYDQFRDTLDEWKIDGVISVTVHSCLPFGIESHTLGKICEEKGVPFMHLLTDYSPGDEGQMRTRIEAFMEMLH